MAVYGVAITPDGVKIAFDAEFWNNPISQQVCLCDTAGTTATAVSLPTGQSAACPGRPGLAPPRTRAVSRPTTWA